MTRKLITSLVAPVIALAFGSVVWAGELATQEGAEVSVRDVVIKDGSATGVVVNDSDLLVRNPRILIRHSWLWANEFEPGSESPGRSEIVTIPAEIPPGESFVFKHDFPVPAVDDKRGRFETSAQIVEFEQVGRQSIGSLR